MATYRDPWKGFNVKRVGEIGDEITYSLEPVKQSIRLPRAYTAIRQRSGGWMVSGHQGRMLRKGSALHSRIAAACDFQYYGR